MNIDNLTFAQIKEIKSMFSEPTTEKSPWIIGKPYFIRTVTMHLVGKLTLLTDKELLLEECSWIADSGRFHNSLKDGTLDEVEPFVDNVIVNRDCIVDATEWKHELPKKQK